LFKTERGSAARNYFEERISELQRQYDAIVEQANHTDLIYNAKYNFIPKVGHIYYLYLNEDILFLSMISPKEWDKYEFVGSFRFTINSTWEKA
jgi:hypothetical protein